MYDDDDGFYFMPQNDIGELERTRESMARELVNLSNRNEDLELKMKDQVSFQRKFTVGDALLSVVHSTFAINLTFWPSSLNLFFKDG